MKYTVPLSWMGEVCVILAGGPSLKDEDLSIIAPSKARTITINDTWRLYPKADVHYFADYDWWARQIASNPYDTRCTTTFFSRLELGVWITGSPLFELHPNVRNLLITGQTGLETKPTALRHGSNSGYQAINLAYHFGVKKIILLGYDMKCDGNRTHWHGESRETPEHFNNQLAKTFLPHFQTLVAPLKKSGVEVINATLGSALTVWPTASLKEALTKTGEDEWE